MRRASVLFVLAACAHATSGSGGGAPAARALMDAGLSAEASGDLPGARRSYERAALLAPSDPRPLVYAGNAAFATGALGDAVAAFQEALARDSLDTEAHNNLAWTLLTRDLDGDLAEAARHAEKAVSLAGDRPEFTHTLAMIELRRGNRQRAEDLLVRALGQAIESDATTTLRAQIASDLGRTRSKS